MGVLLQYLAGVEGDYVVAVGRREVFEEPGLHVIEAVAGAG